MQDSCSTDTREFDVPDSENDLLNSLKTIYYYKELKTTQNKYKMAITIIENVNGYAPELRIKDLLKKDYLIVSKKFDTPLEFPNRYTPNTDGKRYKFALQLHEYSQMDPDTEERTTEKPDIEVGRWEGDNEYQGRNGEWVSSKGTILKALEKAAVDEQLKITMVENDKGKKVYKVESLGATEPKPAAPVVDAAPAPASDAPLTMDAKIQAMKVAGLSLDEAAAKLKAEFGAPDAVIKQRWEAL